MQPHCNKRRLKHMEQARPTSGILTHALRSLAVWGVLLVCLGQCDTAHAYLGPAAGFAFVSSFFILFYTLLISLFILCTWPVRLLWRAMRRAQKRTRARVRRVVILGLDGQDPDLTERMMAEGALPHFSRLRQDGVYRRLRTTLPAESPVAWSSFQTGCNPGKHKVFDFLVPNRTSYLPELSSARMTGKPRRRRLGPFSWLFQKPQYDVGRRSRPFWNVLSDHGFFSAILRVPITFPPEPFHGVLLSAMCVPDLRGSQGTFSLYSSDPDDHGQHTGGQVVPLTMAGETAETHILGPDDDSGRGRDPLRASMRLRRLNNGGVQAEVNGRSTALRPRDFSSWVTVDFRPSWGVRIRGMVRFYLLDCHPHLRIYMTAVQIDPARPALPIAHPLTYAMYLAKTQERFTTLGLAEDTWALNERVLDEEAFLQQAYQIHEERERMFFDALEKVREGVVVCVFDITDRLQHMFFRYLDPKHPANRGKDVERHKMAVDRLYRDMDDLVGRVRAALDEETVLLVMSDHGFKPFRRGVNLNAWLREAGYLVTRDGALGAEWLREVDWSRTRAYAVGLGGIYLNLDGREAQGIVAPEEAEALKRELRESLCALRDPANDEVAVREVYDTREAYHGPYTSEAPDLIAGFAPGYRASWDCVSGVVTGPVFSDNEKSWSGDHCMNPPDVPGILFANRDIADPSPSIMDLGPTVLDLFGIPTPPWCDGRPLMPEARS